MPTEPFAEHREKPWGYEIIYTPPALARVGKILFVNAGQKLSLQYHDQKEETIALFSGSAILHIGENQDSLQKIQMQEKAGYTVYPGIVHRIEALEDSFFLEVSTPETGTTFRLSDDYDRPDEVR